MLILTVGVDCGLESIKCDTEGRFGRGRVRHDFGQGGPEQARVRAREEPCDPQTGRCELVAMAVR
ncbi:MAG TPA: hypothetical protein VM715_11255, partial [Candidatus Acidoferrum sp.]|nr:hypothetical protein [Candidatus Acidoferrum sp.]